MKFRVYEVVTDKDVTDSQEWYIDIEGDLYFITDDIDAPLYMASSQMNVHQNKVFDLMINMWYNELENGKDFQSEGVSMFEIWCIDNLETEEQKAIMEKIKNHVDAISDILYCEE